MTDHLLERFAAVGSKRRYSSGMVRPSTALSARRRGRQLLPAEPLIATTAVPQSSVLWWRMLRTVPVWTWDVGERKIDLDARPDMLAPVLETILEGGLWNQFRKFPVDTLARLLPHLRIPSHTRRLIELWINEAPARTRTKR